RPRPCPTSGGPGPVEGRGPPTAPAARMSLSRLPVIRHHSDFPVHHPALQPPRLVDNPFEQPRDRVGSERTLDRDAADVIEHLLLALRLIHPDAQLLLHSSDLARHTGAFVQEPHQDFVHPIDVAAKIVKRAHARLSTSGLSARPVRSAPASHPRRQWSPPARCPRPPRPHRLPPRRRAP